MPPRKPMDLSKIQPQIRVMAAQLNQLLRKESQAVELTEQIIKSSVLRKMKDEILKQAKKNALVTKKLGLLQTFMNSVNQINNHITILASSWKQPPSELLIPLAHVCFVADYMKIESFVKFKGTVLKDLYGAAGIAQISSQINALDGYKEALNETAEVTENEIMECLLSVSKKFYRNDPSQIEQVIGKKLVITSPVPPNSQPTNPQHSPQAPPQVPPQRANLPSHNHQAPVHPQSPATQSPPPIIQNNTQQAHLRQSVPPAQFARIYQQKAQIAKQQQYKSKIVFEKEPNLYHPIDLPIFSEPIWADLMKTVKESIQ